MCCASTVEGKLLNNIMKDYNKKARPVIKETDVVHISMDIALPQLMKVVSGKFYSRHSTTEYQSNLILRLLVLLHCTP